VGITRNVVPLAAFPALGFHVAAASVDQMLCETPIITEHFARSNNCVEAFGREACSREREHGTHKREHGTHKREHGTHKREHGTHKRERDILLSDGLNSCEFSYRRATPSG
jgi:hypothetical protein